MAPLFGPDMPVPHVEVDTREFWEACRDHRLVVQRCTGCGSYRFAPTPACYQCQSFDYEWVESAGAGRVYSWTVVHQAVHPAVEAAVPYNVVVVELDDCGGAKLVSNLLGVAPDDLRAGMPVRVEWDDVADDVTLPRFRPA